jgi:hypothetical protein
MGQALDKAFVNWLGDQNEHDRHGSGCFLHRLHARTSGAENDVWRKAKKLRAELLRRLEAGDGPPLIDRKIAAETPTQFLQFLLS